MIRRAVAVGGGHGLSRTLRALRRVATDVSAVVAVADDGGSSGRLRRDLDVVPPGDLRMALAALAEDGPLAELLQYRFARGELAGHAVGNLLIVALRDLVGGDLVEALDTLGRLLDCHGRVLPSSRIPLTLHAETGGGDAISGQADIAASPQLRRVWVTPESPPACAEAVEVIGAADLIVLGPGSLYTSLLPNLLVPDVAAAVAAAKRIAFVGNLREQPGETEGMTLADHVRAVTEHVPGVRPDVVIAHRGPRPAGPGRALDADVELGRTAVHAVDLLDGHDGHDPGKLAAALVEVA